MFFFPNKSWYGRLCKCHLGSLVRVLMGNSGADLGGGSRGAHPPPPWDDLQFSNTTGILQKKKKKCGLLGLKKSKRRVHPLLKKSWIRPCNSIYVACGHLLKSSERWLKLLPNRIIGIIFIAFVDLKVARYWMLHPVTLGWNILKSGKTLPSTIRSVLRQFQYKMRSFKTNCYLPEWATFEKISEIGA